MPKLIDIDPKAKPIPCSRCGVLVPPSQVFVSNPRPKRPRGSIYRMCLLCIRSDSRRRNQAKRGVTRPYITKREKEQLASRGLKRCSTCRNDKPFSAFNLQSDKADGRQSRCRICDLSSKLGVSSAQYAKAVSAHKECQICGSSQRLCVDHDHNADANNAVRGVLCRECNKALGRLQDSLPVVQAALNYVVEWTRRKPAARKAWCAKARAPTERKKMTGLKIASWLLARGKKYCPRCQVVKMVSQFDKKPSTRCGLNSWCKLCTRATYEGIDPLEYAAAKKIRWCQICGTSKRLHVDHDHDFRDRAPVRGVLCSSCNTALGMFGESPETLRRAVAYLRAWSRRASRRV